MKERIMNIHSHILNSECMYKSVCTLEEFFPIKLISWLTYASLRISILSPFSKVSSPLLRPWNEYMATTTRPRDGVDGVTGSGEI